MSITPQSSRSGDDIAYTPNWIKMDTDPTGDGELLSNDDDLYPELDPLDSELNVILDPEENLDYINQETMRR